MRRSDEAQDHDPRRRAEPHRAGHRVRLLLRARGLRAEGAGLRDDHGQFESRRRSPPTTTPATNSTSSRSRSRTCSTSTSRSSPKGVIVQFGGQTPLNLADGLREAGVPIIGTQPESIELAEDRKLFAAMLDKLGIRQTPSGTAVSEDEAVADRAAHRLSGARAAVVRARRPRRWRSSTTTRNCAATCATRESKSRPERPVLVDRFLEDATEVDVDCIADGETAVIGAIMEHIEQAGIHSGDSACVIPPFSLSARRAGRDHARRPKRWRAS